MILIIGSAQARPETLQEMLKISIEHVHGSRLEPGCIFHAVSQDAEDPFRLVFVEKWADQAAIKAHFVVPESHAFGNVLYELAAQPPQMEVFEAQPVLFA
jgi:quinol monooxygenase YgiN